MEQCALCNLTLCDQCIEKPDKCTKCLPPLVLDLTTFTCKKCCTRAVYGKIKADSTVSCCNCPAEYNGLCSDKTNANSTLLSPFFKLKDIYEEYNSTYFIVLFFILLILSILLIMWAVFIFKKSCSRDKKINVEYSPLNQLLNERDEDFRENYNNSNNSHSLHDEDEDYELTATDFKSFNGKIKSTNFIDKNNRDL